MAIEQKLTLTQLESEQNDRYRVRILWTSTQTPPHWNNVSHYGYLYYAINNGTETTVSVRYKLPEETEQTILDTVIEIPVTGTEPVTVSARTWMDTYLPSVGVVELAESLALKPLACTVTATDALIGEASAITIRRSGADHLCSIRYVFGEQSGYLAEDGSITAEETLLAAESISFLIPDSFYAEIPNDTRGTCYLYCTTYSDGVQVGEVQEASFTALANEERCKPLVTGTVVDVNEITTALTGDDRVFIRYHSDALCTITPEAQYNATIQDLRINGEVIDGSSLEILSVEQTQVQFAAKDSRGYETVIEEPITLIPYTHLTSTPQVERDDPTSGNATLRYTGLCFSGSFGAAQNDLTFEYKIDSGEFLPAEIEYSVEDGRYTAEVKLSGLDYRKVFNITARVSDRLETVEKKLTLKKGIPVFDWGEGDFAFHVPVQMDGDLNVDGTLEVGGKSLLDLFYPVGTVYMTVSTSDPTDLFGGTWEQLQSDNEAVLQWKRTG